MELNQKELDPLGVESLSKDQQDTVIENELGLR